MLIGTKKSVKFFLHIRQLCSNIDASVRKDTSKQLPLPALKRMINSVVIYYEECLGLTEVHKARSDVTKHEEQLYQAQVERRKKQTEIKTMQDRLKEIHVELDRTNRGDDKYLLLLTEEHASIKREQSLLSSFEELETKEREAFQSLSNKVRISHEREREREERTKYWSLTGSLLGAILGIVGTTIANEVRMKHLREILPTSKEVRPILDEMVNLLQNEQAQVLQVNQFLYDLKKAFQLDSPTSKFPKLQYTEGSSNEILTSLKSQSAKLNDQMEEFKRLIRTGHVYGGDSSKTIVYVGDGVEEILRQTERNLESKIKLQTLISVVAVYSIVALALPAIYFYFNK